MDIDIGARLKEERERLNVSQAALAEIGGKKKLAQLKYEQGESSPTAAYLERIAAIGVDVLYVLTGERAAGLPAGLSADEQLLLESYRGLPVPKQKALLAQLLTGGAGRPTARKPAAGVSVAGNNNRTAGRNYEEKT